jgi:DNA-binding IscR family transcriptional regulator
MHYNIKHTLISYVVLVLLFIYGSYQTLSVETISYMVGISLKYQNQIVHPYLFLKEPKSSI